MERNGYRCFVAYRDIPRGVVWAAAIADAIDESAMMVVVFSQSFNISPQTDREIELASENKMPILTYRIANDEMTGAKKYYLKNLNWIDAFPNPENYFGRLLDSVVKLRAPKNVSNSNKKKWETVSLKKSSCPEGAINGIFSVSPTEKVYFSKGNLQYQASTGIWRFAERQYDIIGESNKYISSNYNGWIDLFGWGTGDDPTKKTEWFIGRRYERFVDWGNNPINGGGETAGQWRTLGIEEWRYILMSRETMSGARCVLAKVNNVNGMILLPDNWEKRLFPLKYDWNEKGGFLDDDNDCMSFRTNCINKLDWKNILEVNGCVFLPASGSRSGDDSTGSAGESGSYWSATDAHWKNNAFELSFFDNQSLDSLFFDDYDEGSLRCDRYSVRLVCPA